MKCLNCQIEIGSPKKYEVTNCRCGAKLMLIEINKVKTLVDLNKDSNKQKR